MTTNQPWEKSSIRASRGKDRLIDTTSVQHPSLRPPQIRIPQIQPCQRSPTLPLSQPAPGIVQPTWKRVHSITLYLMINVGGNGFKDIELSTIGQHRWTFLRQLKLCTYWWNKNTTGRLGQLDGTTWVKPVWVR